MTDPHLQTYVCLSTRHVSPETGRWLLETDDHWISTHSDGCGSFVSLAGEPDEHWPDDLKAVVWFCKGRWPQAAWLDLDGDAPVLANPDELPTFDW